MKVIYILSALFFPAFLLINVPKNQPLSSFGENTKNRSNTKTKNDVYNYRNSGDQHQSYTFKASPKKDDISITKEISTDKVETEVINNEAVQVVIEQPVIKEEVVADEKPDMAIPDHSTFDKILRAHVSNAGKVDYKGIIGQKEELQSYLKSISAVGPDASWNANEQLAYWINVYNAYTIKLIIDNYPISSITNLDDGKPWDRKWIKIGGNTYSLNNIENDIIRVKFKEPRIHFAVNCAAKSCPPLFNKAWTGENLETALEKQTKNFINSSQYNTISKGDVKVSKIFDWYKVDFGNLVTFLNRYSSTTIDKNAKISFKEYNWNLNE